MNTPSNAVPESPRRLAGHRARGHRRRLGPCTGRCGANCGRTARSTSRRWSSPRVVLFGFADQHDRPAASAGAPCCCSTRRSSEPRIEQAVRHRGDDDHADRVHRRDLLLPRRAARRTPRSQHPVLEVAAGFGSHDRALEGEHSARGPAAGHLRDHRRHAADHAAAEHRRPAGERPESRDAVGAAAAVPVVAGAALRPGRASRSGMRRSTAGCCWSRPGRGARRSSGPCCRRSRSASSRRSRSTPRISPPS